MHRFLSFLVGRSPSIWVRYGSVIVALSFITLFRLAVPLDTAPFLLYLPAVFLISVAFGRGPGLVGIGLSAVFAAGFFVKDDPHGWQLSSKEIVALVEYLLVGGAMVEVCDALRRVIFENEASLARLSEVNAVLLTSQTTLAVANQKAEAAKEEAIAANAAKSAFLANMSHELRTPLSAVIGYTELLEEEVEELGVGDLSPDLAKIKSNAKHLLTLINDVLDLSKVEANKMEIFAEDIEVATFTRDAAATVDTLVRTKSNTLTLDLADDLGTMHSDAVKLRQCLFNLLSNACKFTENGRITLRVRREASPAGDWLTFAIEDSGIGMTPEQVQRLFQRFTQADETTTRKFGGTGLGLALSRAFSKLLGGDITVESTEGKGTCFTLRVLATAPDAEPDDVNETPPAGEDAPVDAARDLVLVIDDEASQRDLMTRFLHRQNFTVRTASDGRSGLAMARSLKPRVILLDVMMPDMDGWSVLKALKADAGTAHVPVVMVSFVAEVGLSTAMGAADAVPKPVDWSRLKTVMEQYHQTGGEVLVVDDDANARDRLRVMLEKNGWAVQEAANGAEALERVMHTPPHLILLDLTMPVMDGFAFLHRLRETPGCSEIPVVVLSARDISRAEQQQLASADRVLKKGETSMKDLAAELRTLEGIASATTASTNDEQTRPSN